MVIRISFRIFFIVIISLSWGCKAPQEHAELPYAFYEIKKDKVQKLSDSTFIMEAEYYEEGEYFVNGITNGYKSMYRIDTNGLLKAIYKVNPAKGYDWNEMIWGFSEVGFLIATTEHSDVFWRISKPGGQVIKGLIKTPKGIYSSPSTYVKVPIVGPYFFIPLYEYPPNTNGPKGVVARINYNNNTVKYFKMDKDSIPCGSRDCHMPDVNKWGSDILLTFGCSNLAYVIDTSLKVKQRLILNDDFAKVPTENCEALYDAGQDMFRGFRWKTVVQNQMAYQFTELPKRLIDIGPKNANTKLIIASSLLDPKKVDVYDISLVGDSTLMPDPHHNRFYSIRAYKGGTYLVTYKPILKGSFSSVEVLATTIFNDPTYKRKTIDQYVSQKGIKSSVIIWFPFHYSCPSCVGGWLSSLITYKGAKDITVISDTMLL
jgi:hypothetical protein